MDAKLLLKNGKPVLSTVKGEMPFFAYTTYFTENACYEDFAEAGYHMYSICCYFTEMPINSDSGFTPARRGGIFSVKNKPNYFEFDEDVADLLKKDPQALIFPRVYVSMPGWWIAENPTEIVPTNANPEGREMLFSDKFKETAAEMLKKFVTHVKESDYADAIIGYHISAGKTQEWFHFDFAGSFCENAYPYFCEYMEQKSKGITANYTLEKFMNNEYYSDYVRFANQSVAETVEYFSSIVKREVDYKQIVGVFYGYTFECNTFPCCGTFAMEKLLDSKNIDFFCSPFSYIENRRLGADIIHMIAYGSVKTHKKAYILEADIRTFLSKYPHESRKDIIIKNLYTGAIWLGEPTQLGTLYQLRRAFAKTVTGTGGLWWFDMWGGWYHSEESMVELKKYRELMDSDFSEPLPSSSRVAVIVDERMQYEKSETHWQREFCKKIYLSGHMADVYLLCDFEKIKNNYDVFFFPQSSINADIEKSLNEKGKTFLYGKNISEVEIAETCQKANLQPLAEAGDVLYEGNGFVSLHALVGGRKTIVLPKGYGAQSFIGEGATINGNEITFETEQFDTHIFRIIKAQ